jgi:CBS domain-containing protein
MKELVDFLGAQPPYDRLDAKDLDRLARAVEVEFFPADTMIVQADAGHRQYARHRAER